MKEALPNTIYLKDYKKPGFQIPETYLEFHLDDEKTMVKSKLLFIQTTGVELEDSLFLHGEHLEFDSIKFDGGPLDDSFYEVKEDGLLIKKTKEKFSLEIVNYINPSSNKALEGLYKSGNIFCTQNEPEGFRRITYFLDRSDVMSVYKTKIIADKKQYPVLLSNGNPVGKGELEGGKHWVEWHDPFKKPSYLFALVAGDLEKTTDHYKTKSGRDVLLEIYVDKGNGDKTSHAMESLKKAMKWDEEVYNLEYDLDIYMIVAVDAFNMGAMENKGLNIFNSRLVLAKAETATDYIFHCIEGVVGHEYFHNWTGNRVTCRDWFQLTLKEGLTVFRDQEFSSDMQSRAVQRIDDVNMLRERQFEEDAGPMAHPIRPESFIEINNFYTSTVYEKGAEVIRMIHTLIGDENFKKGIEKYFELFDGQAVTCNDFIHAMAVVSGHNFEQFMNWYSQAGTPRVKAKWSYNEKEQSLTLSIGQSCPSTPGQKDKKPFYFPFKVGFLDSNGKEIPGRETTLIISKESEDFVFDNFAKKPHLSLNRNFSAPIILEADYTDEELAFLFSYDSDNFNRREAGQTLATRMIKRQVDNLQNDRPIVLEDNFKSAFKNVLLDKELDLSFKELALKLPGQILINQIYDVIPFDDIHQVISELTRLLAESFIDELKELYFELDVNKEYEFNSNEVGRRRLKNLSLSYMAKVGSQEIFDICFKQFQKANNMTDEIKALNILADTESKERDLALKQFYDKWKNDKLVMNLWFQAQSYSPVSGSLEKVKNLMKDPIFNIKIPNCARSVLSLFAKNYIHFHKKDGSGYQFMADTLIEIDSFNPSLASLLSGSFKNFGQLDCERKDLCRIQLERVLNHEGLSKNTYEIISKTLAV